VRQPPERGIQPRRHVAVDHGAGDALLVQVDQFPRRQLGGLAVGLARARAQMRQHQVGDVRHALGPLRILGIDIVQEAQLLLGLDRPQVGFVEDARAGAVDQRGPGLHPVEQGRG
jgi:hypothetical protein